MRRLLVWALLLLLFGCGGGGGGSNPSGGGGSPSSSVPALPVEVVLVGVEVSPAQQQLAVGLSTTLRLFAVYTNGLRLDVSDRAVWSSSDTGVVSLTGSVARAVAVGQAQVTGRFEGKSSVAQIVVTPASLNSLRVEPATAEVAAGLTQQFRALGQFSDGTSSDLTSSASWSVSDTALGRVEAAGLIRGLQPGTVTVTASLQGLQAQARLQVNAASLTRIEVNPNPVSLPVGIAQPFVATGFFTDGTARVITQDCSWSSSDTEVLLVSDQAGSKGLAAGLKQGTAQIEAQLLGLSGTASVTLTAAVLQSLEISPDPASVPVGLQQAFRATGRFSDQSLRDLTEQVVWSSGQPAVASISNVPGNQGQASGVSEGLVTIQARLDGVEDTAQLTVTAAILRRIEVSPANPEVPRGLTRQFTATGTLSDNSVRDLTNQVTWLSSNPLRASIDAKGLATALATGSTQIEASLEGISGSTLLTVTPAILQSVEVTPANTTLPKGLTRAFQATGRFSDNSTQDITQQATWSSSSPSVASLSNLDGARGVATALELGQTTVRAQMDGLEGQAALEVTAPQLLGVFLEPSEPSLPQGTFLPIQVVARYSDGSQVDLTRLTSQPPLGSPEVVLTSSDPNLLQVRFDPNTGYRNLLYGLGKGSVSLDCRTALGNTSTQVTVTDAQLRFIEIAPNGVWLSSGQIQDLTALGHYSSGEIVDLTQQATWLTDDIQVASVSNAPGTQGRLTAGDKGQTAVRAVLGGVEGSTQVLVNAVNSPATEWTHRQGLDVDLVDLTSGQGLWLGLSRQTQVARVSTDGEHWEAHRMRPSFSRSQFTAFDKGRVAFGEGRFVAQIDSGLGSTSLDGRSWTPFALPFSEPLDSLTYGNGIFLGNANRTFWTSDDGLTWTSREDSLSGQIVFANGEFFLCSASGLFRSTNGQSWTPVPLSPPDSTIAIAYGNGIYVVTTTTLAGPGGAVFWGADLNALTRAVVPSPQNLTRVVFSQGRFVALDSLGDKYASEDGQTWTAVGSRGGPLLAADEALGFVTAATEGYLRHPRLPSQRSSDGLTWVNGASLNSDLSNSALVSPLTFGPHGFVWLGQKKAHFSPDGVNWITQATTGLETQDLRRLFYLGGHYYTQSNSVHTGYLRSDDAVHWTDTLQPMGMGDITYGKGIYVQVHPLATSRDGLQFTPVNQPLTNIPYRACAYGNGRFVASAPESPFGGSSGYVVTSSDAVTWTAQSLPYGLSDLEFAFGRFIGVNYDSGIIASSEDGVTWTVRDAGTFWGYLRLVSGNGRILAVGNFGVASSADGLNWTFLPQAGYNLSDMAAGNGMFVGTGVGGSLVTSP